MATMAWACAIVTGVIAITFLPFAAGGYDPMAAPPATMAWVLGRVGLLMVPIGLLWHRALSKDRTARPRWLVRLSGATCVFILGVMSVIAFAASGSLLLGTGTAAVATLFLARLARQIRRHPATPLPRMVPALITVARRWPAFAGHDRGGHVSSWWRQPDASASVRGHRSSSHLRAVSVPIT